MAFIRSIFHRCNFIIRTGPMKYECRCGRKRWGLFEEGR